MINRLRGKSNAAVNIDKSVNSFGNEISEPKVVVNLLNYSFSYLGEYFGKKTDYITYQTKRKVPMYFSLDTLQRKNAFPN